MIWETAWAEFTKIHASKAEGIHRLQCLILRGGVNAVLAYCTQVAYILSMQATFVELPPFERNRKDYLDDDAYRLLQRELMENPTAGAVIEGTGGLRKLRPADPRRGKGKRGGLRVIYYWWLGGNQFWLFTVYDKDQADDLTPAQRKVLRLLLKSELENRQTAGGERND
jgi:hypothetical protein